jgi:hypothetical protein
VYPLEFLVVLAVGIAIGYVLSRLRYQGIVEAQKVHLGIKDEAIKTAGAQRTEIAVSPLPNSVTPPSAIQQSSEPPRAPSAGDPRFTAINARIVAEIEAKIRKAVLSRPYKFVYNPENQRSKTVVFLPNGEVGEGRNDNEYNWRVASGKLEFIKSNGQLQSRFYLLPDGKSFHHTNEIGNSIIGQILTPI